MIKVFTAAEGLSACLPASLKSSWDGADIMLVLRLRKFRMVSVCISGPSRIPTAQLYNRCKQRRRILDRFVADS
jgi:hypothetical protein